MSNLVKHVHNLAKTLVELSKYRNDVVNLRSQQVRNVFKVNMVVPADALPYAEIINLHNVEVTHVIDERIAFSFINQKCSKISLLITHNNVEVLCDKYVIVSLNYVAPKVRMFEMAKTLLSLIKNKKVIKEIAGELEKKVREAKKVMEICKKVEKLT